MIECYWTYRSSRTHELSHTNNPNVSTSSTEASNTNTLKLHSNLDRTRDLTRVDLPSLLLAAKTKRGLLELIFLTHATSVATNNAGQKKYWSSLSSMDSDLEAFSHNPTDDSVSPLIFQSSEYTNYLNQRFLSYWVELLLRWLSFTTIDENSRDAFIYKRHFTVYPHSFISRVKLTCLTTV